MATVMGGESGSWHYTPRLARSSDSGPDVTRPRSGSTASDNKSKPIVDSNATTKQPCPVAAYLETPNEEDVLSQKVSKILKHIERLIPSARNRDQEIPDVDPDVWNLLQRNHAESLSWKLEYLHPERLIILTFPSGVHETFNVLLKPITALVADGPFVVATNHDIHLSSGSSVTPDFAFGKMMVGSSVHYSIIFECAWSQPKAKLAEKIEKCLADPGVLAVVSIEILAPKQFRTPTDPLPSDLIFVPAFPESVLRKRKLLGPVEYGHTWGQMEEITLTIHHQGGDVEIFDRLAPVDGNTQDDDLFDVQDRVNIALAKLLGNVMTRDVFTSALAGTFELNWDRFYKALDAYLVADAYDRYKAWVMARGLPAPKRSLDRDNLDDDWASSVVQRRSKKTRH